MARRSPLFAMLSDPELRACIDDADLFAIAYAILGSPPLLDVNDAIEALIQRGLPLSIAREALASRMAAAVREDRAFVAYNDRKFCLDRNHSLQNRLARFLAKVNSVEQRRAQAAPQEASPASPPRPRTAKRPAAAAPPRAPATPASAKRSAAAALPRSPATPASSKRSASAAPPRSPAAPASAKRPAAAAPSKAPAASATPPKAPTAAAAAPALPPVPATPPIAPAAAAFALPEEADVARVLAAPPASLAAVRHVLAAHALAMAETFEELLALRLVTDVEPHRYQTETVRRVLRAFRGRALLADEVGLGKTVEALLILREYQLRGAVRRALVIVPPALVGQWVGELTAKAQLTPRTTEDAALRADPEAFWQRDGVVVASLATARAPRHAAAVQAAPWDLVIVDEAHHVKNRTTASFKLIDGLKSRFLLLLTATPIETDLEELYNLVTLLKPGQFATPAAFRAQFVDRKDPLSPRNRERLRGLLAEVMVRNTRADSGLALPPRYVSTVAVDPLPEERALYDGVVAFLRAHGADAPARMLAATLLLEAGSSPAAVRGTLARAMAGEKRTPAQRAALAALAEQAAGVPGTRKSKALVDLVRAHPDKVLVFTRFRDTLADLERALSAAGIAPLTFHGGLSAEAKQRALAAFREGGKVLLATDVGGEGQNLHHCHVLVNFDLPYNPMLIEQRIGRLHRMGQKEEVRVYNLCARGTAEERVLDLLDSEAPPLRAGGRRDGHGARQPHRRARSGGADRGALRREPVRRGDRTRLRRHRGRARRRARPLRAGQEPRQRALREGLRGVSAEIPEPLGFVLAALEAEGALCERHAEDARATAILPADVARRLALPEDATLAIEAGGRGEVPCGLGSTLLETLVAEARARCPAASLRLDAEPPRPAHARALAGRFVLRNGLADVEQLTVGTARYASAYAAYTVESDDRREGLVRVVTGEDGAEPDDAVASRLDPAWPDAALLPAAPVSAVAEATRWIAIRAGQAVRAAVAPLCADVARRQGRDHDRIADYFAALIAEARAPRRKVEPKALEAKVAHLVAERDKKLRDLGERYAVRITATLAAVVWAELPALNVAVKLRRRKLSRSIVLRVPAFAHAVDRLACEGCGAATAKPAACDERLHLLCEVCVPNAQGRFACPACGSR
ncbi:MAG: SNF2-related protein [Minicystis sp.]